MILNRSCRFWSILIFNIVLFIGLAYILHICVTQKLLDSFLNRYVEDKNGLGVSWFNNHDFSGESRDSISKLPVSFTEKDAPWKGENFSLKYRGVLKVPETGAYRIGTASDDGSYIYLNGQLIINNGGVHPLKEEKTSLYLTKGLYLFELDYFQIGGGLALLLFWERPGADRELIGNEYVFLLRDSFPRERFSSITNFLYRFFDLLKHILFILLFLAICLFISYKLDFSCLFKLPDSVQQKILRHSYIWLILIGIISVISNVEIWVVRYWPFIYILHFLALYLFFIFAYSLLKKESGYWGLKDVIIFSGVYMAGYTLLMFMNPLESSMNIEDMGYCFTRAGQFLRGDYTDMDYPVLAYVIFGACYKLSMGNFNIFLMILTFVRLLFLIWCFYFFYSFSESMKRPSFGFIFSLFFLIAPFSINWLFLRYDIIPTAFLIGSLFYFYKRRYYLSCILNVFGFMSKWFPILFMPFMFFYLFYRKQYRELIKVIVLYIFIISAFILIFSPEAFFAPFAFQGKRLVMGESFFNMFLIWYHGPQRLAGIVRDLPQQGIFTSGLLFAIILTALSIVFLIFLFKLLKEKKNNIHLPIVFGCWAVISLILFNRIYSPQFIRWFYGAVFVISLIGLRSAGAYYRWIINTLFILWLASIANLIVTDPYGFFHEHYIYQKLLFWVLFITVCLKLLVIKNED